MKSPVLTHRSVSMAAGEPPDEGVGWTRPGRACSPIPFHGYDLAVPLAFPHYQPGSGFGVAFNTFGPTT